MTDLNDIALVMKAMMKVVSDRVLTMLCLVMTFALFCWAMYLGAWLNFVIAGAFGIIIFLPVLLGNRQKGGEHATD